MVINAATILHLNQTAVEFAYHFIQQTEVDIVIDQVSKRYQVDKSKIKAEIRDLKVKRGEAIEKHDHKELKELRRKIRELKRQIRKATV